MIDRWKGWAQLLKREIAALYVAYQDPRTPWGARVFLILVVGYAFSPIDLIPDFVPVLGYVDDLLLLPLGVWLALRWVPPQVMDDARTRVLAGKAEGRPANRGAVFVIVLLWLGTFALALGWAARWWYDR